MSLPFFFIYISIALMILFREIRNTYSRVHFNVTRFAILSVEFLINSLLSLPDSTWEVRVDKERYVPLIRFCGGDIPPWPIWFFFCRVASVCVNSLASTKIPFSDQWTSVTILTTSLAQVQLVINPRDTVTRSQKRRTRAPAVASLVTPRLHLTAQVAPSWYIFPL